MSRLTDWAPEHGRLYTRENVVSVEQRNRPRCYVANMDDGQVLRLNSVSTIAGIADDKGWAAPWGAKEAVLYLQQVLRMDPGIGKRPDALDRACKDAKGAHRRKKETAASYGSMVHDFAEKHRNSGGTYRPVLNGLPTEVLNGWDAYLRWANKGRLETLRSESLVYSIRHGFAGTLDGLGRDTKNGKFWLEDYKCSARVKEPYMAQLGGYALCLEEEGVEVYGGVILRFDKETGGLEVWPIYDKDFELCKQAFLGLSEGCRCRRLASEALKKAKKKMKCFPTTSKK